MKTTKYYIKGRVEGKLLHEYDTEKLGPSELVPYEDEINGFIEEEMDYNLAEYLSSNYECNAPIFGVVTDIRVRVKAIDGKLFSITEVTAKDELSASAREALLDYLEGQFSDGYGESLEQRAFMEFKDYVEFEEYDPDTEREETRTEYVLISAYISLSTASPERDLEFMNSSNGTVRDGSTLKYYIKGCVMGNKAHEYDDEELSPSELAEYASGINDFIRKKMNTNLAKLLGEYEPYDYNSELIGLVTDIRVGVKVIDGELFSVTEVCAKRKLSETEEVEVTTFLWGQFSDGYGAILEQTPFMERQEWVAPEVYNPESGVDAKDDVSVTVKYFLSLYMPKPPHQLQYIANPDEEVVSDTSKNIPAKPKCKLSGADSNIFNLLGIASRALVHQRMYDASEEMFNRATHSNSFNEALAIIAEYVDIY